ncbi:hypothetical protein DN826_21035 [Stutzerimonas nosocomialis]|uniref:Sel1 repeat family protein n=1 Tax=Stutzerimonas nosocomialis TaxID=1056496 RepID=A0A5R9QD14_9GAMM|nr:hypothetical protein [Stutzerimonas nosocomialis]TLX52929.1 hypothetical protein DN826_21035 [Stutzerimonas nosocomialis]TLX62788.1 hypothetical protein DN820_14325 [Stutzerimonas nosocomialis]
MKTPTMIVLLLALGGCASQSCDMPWSESACREDRLLYQNDLMQAKILIASGDEEGYELAHALLNRSARQDQRGETEFYRALLMIRQGPQTTEVIRMLDRAADKDHPHAIALLYKIYDEPYLVDQPDPAKARQYRERYGELDVAQSGYPSFDKAREVVDQLLDAPQQLVEQRTAEEPADD